MVRASRDTADSGSDCGPVAVAISRAVVFGLMGLTVGLGAGCTLQMSVGRPGAVQPAEKSAVAKGQTNGDERAYLPDHLNDDADAAAENGQRGTAGSMETEGEAGSRSVRGRASAMNVFGEFEGQNRGGSFAAEPRFKQHTTLQEGYDADIAVDPSGRRMVFASTRDGEHANLYLQSTSGGPVTQLTSGQSDDAQPAFSPDGQHIAFCSNRSGTWDLYLMNADGSGLKKLTNGARGLTTGWQSMHPSFSPDGKRLVYSALPGTQAAESAEHGEAAGAMAEDGEGTGGEAESNAGAASWQIWVLDLGTLEQKYLGPGLFPSWSPRGDVDRIAFQKARKRGSRCFGLWTLDIIGGEARRTSEIAVSSNSALVCPSWSPDGKRLAFASIVEPGRTQNGKPQGQTDIWVLEADFNTRRRLTDGRASNLTPYWAADQRVYFISDRTRHETVWSVAADLRKHPAAVEPAEGSAPSAGDGHRGDRRVSGDEGPMTRPTEEAQGANHPATVGETDGGEVGN